MRGLIYILIAYLLGEGVSLLINGFIPGSVLGMLILFGALQSGVLKAEKVKGAAKLLVDNLMLFFIPACVGLMVSYKLIADHWVGVVAIIVVATFAVLAVVGLIQQRMGGGRDANE